MSGVGLTERSNANSSSKTSGAKEISFSNFRQTKFRNWPNTSGATNSWRLGKEKIIDTKMCELGDRKLLDCGRSISILIFSALVLHSLTKSLTPVVEGSSMEIHGSGE